MSNLKKSLIKAITEHPGCTKAEAIRMASNSRTRMAARYRLEDLIKDGIVACEYVKDFTSLKVVDGAMSPDFI